MQRVDGRETYDYRDINITLGKEPGSVEVTLGRTRSELRECGMH